MVGSGLARLAELATSVETGVGVFGLCLALGVTDVDPPLVAGTFTDKSCDVVEQEESTMSDWLETCEESWDDAKLGLADKLMAALGAFEEDAFGV